MPAPANKAARSHAVKTALQLRSITVAGGDSRGGAADSKRTAQCKNELKGRFRLGAASIKSHSDRPKAKSQTKIRHATFQGTEAAPEESRIVSAPASINQNHLSSNYLSGVGWFGANILDPFGTIPIPPNPRIDMLLKNCIVFFDYLTTTVPSHKTWLGLAIKDPLLIRVTLCMTAAFGDKQAFLFSLDLRKEGWKLKGEVINEVNLILQSGRVTENLLAAIAHLGHVASLEGSLEEADIHMRGLHGLIALKGGIKSIKAYQVGRFINWVDLELATTRGRRPLYPLHYGLDRVKLPWYIVEPCEYPALSHLQSLGPGHETIITVIQLLRQRVMAAKCNIDRTLRDIRALSLSIAFLTLDHVADIPTTPEGKCLRILLLAAYLFGCVTLKQEYRWTRALPQTVAQRLKASLKTLPTYSAIWADYLPQLLWVLFIGAVVEEEDRQDQEIWFLPQLEVIRQLLGCRGRMEMEGHLHSMVWDDHFGIDFLDNWWANMALLP